MDIKYILLACVILIVVIFQYREDAKKKDEKIKELERNNMYKDGRIISNYYRAEWRKGFLPIQLLCIEEDGPFNSTIEIYPGSKCLRVVRKYSDKLDYASDMLPMYNSVVKEETLVIEHNDIVVSILYDENRAYNYSDIYGNNHSGSEITRTVFIVYDRGMDDFGCLGFPFSGQQISTEKALTLFFGNNNVPIITAQQNEFTKIDNLNTQLSQNANMYAYRIK